MCRLEWLLVALGDPFVRTERVVFGCRGRAVKECLTGVTHEKTGTYVPAFQCGRKESNLHGILLPLGPEPTAGFAQVVLW